MRFASILLLEKLITQTKQTSTHPVSAMEYFFDEDNGIILDKVTRDRCLILTRARLSQILGTLNQIFGSSSASLITAGFLLAGKNFVNEVAECNKKSTTEFMSCAVQRFMNAGLGRIELTEFNPELSTMTIRIWSNFFADIRNNNGTYCDCVSAFVEGMYSEFFKTKVQIKETKCISKGDSYCEWYLTSQKGMQ
jgi:predicted hydrocarbon binding protein